MMDLGRVLIAAGSIGLGGAEKHIASLCRRLAAMGTRCDIVYPGGSKDGLSGELEEAGAGLLPLPISSLRDLARLGIFLGLRKTARGLAPDLVHSHMYHGEVIGALCARFSGAPMVATRHSSGLEFNGVRGFVVRALRGSYSRLIAVSEKAAEEAAGQGFPHSRITVVPNGVDTRLFSPLGADERRDRRAEWEAGLFGEASDGLLIGTMGTLKKLKDQRILIEALGMIPAEGMPGGAAPRLVIMGEGPERTALESLAASSGLAGRVALTGPVREPSLMLPLLDIFVLPSRTEGIPMALLEAMSCRVPSVATGVGGVPEVLGGAGVLVEAGDAPGIASALGRLGSSPGALETVGGACRERVVERYGEEAWVDRTLAVYRQALGRLKRPE